MFDLIFLQTEPNSSLQPLIWQVQLILIWPPCLHQDQPKNLCQDSKLNVYDLPGPRASIFTPYIFSQGRYRLIKALSNELNTGGADSLLSPVLLRGKVSSKIFLLLKMMYLGILGPEKSYSHTFDKYFELLGVLQDPKILPFSQKQGFLASLLMPIQANLHCFIDFFNSKTTFLWSHLITKPIFSIYNLYKYSKIFRYLL